MAFSTAKLFRASLLVLAVLLVAAQLVPLDRTNPPSDPQQHFKAVARPPAAVASVLDRSCRDCHSNDTAWPWYSRIAPMSFLVVDDVNEGRSHLNFSEWGKLDARRSARKLEEICDEIKSGNMPDRKYTLIHPSAKLSPDDIQAICGWTEQVLGK
jgi:hypothetical protein